MNKSDLVKNISTKKGITNQQATDVVESFFQTMSEGLLSGNRIEIRGFGTFRIKEYQGYTGRNPKTSEPVLVAPKARPTFKAGKEIKNALNK